MAISREEAGEILMRQLSSIYGNACFHVLGTEIKDVAEAGRSFKRMRRAKQHVDLLELREFCLALGLTIERVLQPWQEDLGEPVDSDGSDDDEYSFDENQQRCADELNARTLAQEKARKEADRQAS